MQRGKRWLVRMEGRFLRIAVAACIALAVSCAASPVCGQTSDPSEAPRVISPAIQIANLGWTDNVFRVGEGADPVGDYTATVSPSLQASIPWSPEVIEI